MYSSLNGMLFDKDKTVLLCCPGGKEGDVDIPVSVSMIGVSAFYGCKHITSIALPNSVTSIDSGAFQGCSGLTSIIIPNSVLTIEDNTFYECNGLKSIAIPNSITSIGMCAFLGCQGLTSIIIPNSVTSIGWSAFYDCSGLKSLTIPNSVLSIDMFAFGGCDNLKAVYSHAVKPVDCYPGFSDDNCNNTILYIPKDCMSAYKQRDPWRQFQHIVETDFSSVDNIESDVDNKTEVGRFNLQGTKVSDDYKGIVVIRYRDGSCCKKYSY